MLSVIYKAFILSVVMLNVVMLNVVMLNVVMLNVVTPSIAMVKEDNPTKRRRAMIGIGCTFNN
jgi:hypothetical protein